MSANPEATIRVKVDPANPGQFLACCGLLELADRLWDGAEGWFEPGMFHVRTDGTLFDLLKALADNPVEASTVLENGVTVDAGLAQLKLNLPGELPLVLDAWVKTRVEKGIIEAVGNSPWKFWSGQQTPGAIWNVLREALAGQLNDPSVAEEGFFQQLVPLSGRFGFDPVAAWNARDTGFSPNAQGLHVASSPGLELLAMVGLQRFRLVMLRGRSFLYATWTSPLPAAVAAAAASGGLSLKGMMKYVGKVISRGKYSALDYATLWKGERDGRADSEV